MRSAGCAPDHLKPLRVQRFALHLAHDRLVACRALPVCRDVAERPPAERQPCQQARAAGLTIKPTRDQALDQAKQEAVDKVLVAGAVPGSVQIVEVEEVPLAYLPSSAIRMHVKAVGDLQIET